MAEIVARLNEMGHHLALQEDDATEVEYHDETDLSEGTHCWLRINADWIASAGWQGLSSAGLTEEEKAVAETKPMWEIRLLIESDDPAERERITDSLADVLCPLPVSEHDECPTPWFIVATPLEHLDNEEAERWREVLNRD
jgi:hypothetical protein